MAQPKSRPITRDHLKKKQPLEKQLLIPASEADAERLKRAKEDLATAQLVGDEDRMAAARKRLDEVEAQVREDGLHFVFRGIGRRRFEELQRRHPATDAQVLEAEQQGGVATFNGETLMPELLALTITNAELTPEEWREDVLDSDDWGQGEIGLLVGYALGVNRDSRVTQLGN